MHLDEAIASTGHGRFNYGLYAALILAVTAESMEMNLLTFISPCVKEYWGLTTASESSLSSVIFGTSILGTFAWGLVADAVGRRTVTVASTLIDAFFGLASSFSGSFTTLLALRGGVGFGLGGVMQQ